MFEGPLTALVWICGIAGILRYLILGVKIHVGRTTVFIDHPRVPPLPSSHTTYLDDAEEIRREDARNARESAIAKR